MGAAVMGDFIVGGRGADVCNVLHCGVSGCAPQQVVGVGHFLANWEDTGRISPLGDTSAGEACATSELGRDMDAPSHGGGNTGGGHGRGGYLCCPPSEHRHKIYCNKSHYGPASDGVAAPRGTGFETMVGTVEN